MSDGNQQAAAARPESQTTTATMPETAQPRQLPLYKVILHNDDVNVVEDVMETVVMLTPLNKEEACQRTLEAHRTGCALLLVIHRERAELYVEQFRSRDLTVTIEPAS